MFKPNIFVSSVLKLHKFRNKLRSLIESLGGNPIIYEDITPDHRPAMYRHEAAEADFAIVIFEEYGTKTEKGISGTHEELVIFDKYNIPTHVFFKKDPDDEDLFELLNQLKMENVSFYFYKDFNDIYKKIKSKSYEIGRVISIHKLDVRHLQTSVINKLKADYDYKLFISYDAELAKVSDIVAMLEQDHFYFPLLVVFIDSLHYRYLNNDIGFVDGKSSELWRIYIKLMIEASLLHDQHARPLDGHPLKKYYSRFLDMTLQAQQCVANNHFSEPDKFYTKLQHALKAYKKLTDYITNQKTYGDTLTINESN